MQKDQHSHEERAQLQLDWMLADIALCKLECILQSKGPYLPQFNDQFIERGAKVGRCLPLWKHVCKLLLHIYYYQHTLILFSTFFCETKSKSAARMLLILLSRHK